MRILIVGINHSPEPVGIGPYTAEMAQFLAAAGHTIEVVAAKPYYPEWRRSPGYTFGYDRRIEDGVRVIRCPLYVPARPTGARRTLHHLSFALSLIPPVTAAMLRRRPDLVIAVAPSLVAAPIVRVLARLGGSRTWLHVQDFEVGAALATGLLKERSLLGRLAGLFDRRAHAGFDCYSSISPQMCRRLIDYGAPPNRVVEVRNWSDVTRVVPLTRPSAYRAEWDIDRPHVALYSGNIANKQGVQIIVDAARRLQHRDDLMFVVCGDGPKRQELIDSAAGLANIRFYPLQPRERLGELLGLATVHLLPQLESAADLVLPSKLTNMLASGRPVVATAAPGTGLADELEGCGIATPPASDALFSSAIEDLLDDPERCARLGHAARVRAEDWWAKETILRRLEQRIARVAADTPSA